MQKRGVFIHVMISTLGYRPTISPEIEQLLLSEIPLLLNAINSPQKALSIQKEHFHLLFQLSNKHSLVEVLELLKKQTAHRIVEAQLRDSFKWQPGFTAISVGAADLYSVSRFIQNQHNFHQSATYLQERKYFQEKIQEIA